MTRLFRFLPLGILSLLVMALLAACSSNSGSSAAPTPAGLPKGQPTFVYLWTYP